MAADASLFPEDLTGLNQYEGLMSLVWPDGSEADVSWTLGYANRRPMRNENGVTGYVLRCGAMTKVHVCRYAECTAMWRGTKYKVGKEPPVHVRLKQAIAVPPPAVAVGESPPLVHIEADPHDPPPAPGVPAVAVIDVNGSAVADDGNSSDDDSSAVADADVIAGGFDGDAADPVPSSALTLAPAPEPAFVPRPPPGLVEPPHRAALKPAPLLQPLTVTVPAVAGVEQTVETVSLRLNDEVNLNVFPELNDFAIELMKPRRYVGIATFALFALVYRMRVMVWFADMRVDIVFEYMPWALDAIVA